MSVLLQRAADGDESCLRVLANAGAALGFAIANLITLFAPPKVIVWVGRWRRASISSARFAKRSRSSCRPV